MLFQSADGFAQHIKMVLDPFTGFRLEFVHNVMIVQDAYQIFDAKLMFLAQSCVEK